MIFNLCLIPRIFSNIIHTLTHKWRLTNRNTVVPWLFISNLVRPWKSQETPNLCYFEHFCLKFRNICCKIWGWGLSQAACKNVLGDIKYFSVKSILCNEGQITRKKIFVTFFKKIFKIWEKISKSLKNLKNLEKIL